MVFKLKICSALAGVALQGWDSMDSGPICGVQRCVFGEALADQTKKSEGSNSYRSTDSNSSQDDDTTFARISGTHDQITTENEYRPYTGNNILRKILSRKYMRDVENMGQDGVTFRYFTKSKNGNLDVYLCSADLVCWVGFGPILRCRTQL